MRNKILPVVLGALALVSACALIFTGCAKTRTGVNVGAMSGPTAMSMIKIMHEATNDASAYDYQFSALETDPSAFVAPLAKGELDIACIPSNLASVIYNKTEGGVQVIATCNNGVLCVVERGEEDIYELSDLAGKTIYMTGEGAVPEYTVRYLLSQAGVDFDNDIDVVWCADTTEALAYINNTEGAVAILPQPFVTAACAQVEDLNVVVDLNAEWDRVVPDCSIITAVVVARTEYVKDNPKIIKRFLEDYEASINYTSSNIDEAADLIEKYGIVAKAQIAKSALPQCHLNYMTGDEMEKNLSAYLQILYDQNPASVGGSMPSDDFYYKK